MNGSNIYDIVLDIYIFTITRMAQSNWLDPLTTFLRSPSLNSMVFHSFRWQVPSNCHVYSIQPIQPSSDKHTNHRGYLGPVIVCVSCSGTVSQMIFRTGGHHSIIYFTFIFSRLYSATINWNISYLMRHVGICWYSLTTLLWVFSWAVRLLLWVKRLLQLG